MPYKNKADYRKCDAKRRVKPERRQYRKDWYKKNGERNYLRDRNYQLKRNYGITSADFDEMLASQSGGCAICAKKAELVVDHDHTTGLVRKLLCQNCNKGLGNFFDSPELLRLATSYLVAFDEVS